MPHQQNLAQDQNLYIQNIINNLLKIIENLELLGWEVYQK